MLVGTVIYRRREKVRFWRKEKKKKFRVRGPINKSRDDTLLNLLRNYDILQPQVFIPDRKRKKTFLLYDEKVSVNCESRFLYPFRFPVKDFPTELWKTILSPQ